MGREEVVARGKGGRRRRTGSDIDIPPSSIGRA